MKALSRPAVVLSLLVLVIGFGVSGDPLVRLDTGLDWGAPQIGPVPLGPAPPEIDWDSLLDLNDPFYPVESPYLEPQLYVYDSPLGGGTTEDAGLVMAWGDPDPSGEDAAAAWKFVYDEDPDLIGLTLSCDVLPPAVPAVGAISNVGLALVDGSGLVRSWVWQCGPLAGQIANNDVWTLSTGVILPGPGTPATAINGGGDVVLSTVFSDPAFDPAAVVAILGIADGVTTIAFPEPDPVQQTINPTGVWNWWGDLAVVPEPGTLALLAAAFACGFVRRRRR